MQKLSITKRPGETKGSISSRPEIHGDDTVPALTISIGGIVLFPKDICKMYNDEEAHNRLFKRTDAGLVPAFPGSLIRITEIFKGAKVTIQTSSMKEPLILKPATVKEIWLEAQDAGGQVIMSCKILGAPPDDAKVNPLHMVDKKCTIAILNGALAEKDDRQTEMNLEGAEPAEGDEGEDGDGQETEAEREEREATAQATGDEPSGMARKIARAEAAKKRAKRKQAH